jgi:hypothetical protein
MMPDAAAVVKSLRARAGRAMVPSVMAWISVGLVILAIGGPPLLFLLALPPWLMWSCARGMKLRSRTVWRLELREERLEVWVGPRRRWQRPLSAVQRARDARNANWTGSTFVEDALTLYDADGRALKIPSSAQGFSALLDALHGRQVPIARVDVSAPVFLD